MYMYNVMHISISPSGISPRGVPLHTHNILLNNIIIFFYAYFITLHLDLNKSSMNVISVERRISDVVYDLDSTFGF